MSKEISELDIETIEIINSMDSAVKLEEYLSEINSKHDRIRYLKHLNRRINSKSQSIKQLYTLYFYRRYVVKEKGTIDLFENPNPYLGKKIKIPKEQIIAFKINKLQLDELINNVPLLIEEIQTGGLGKNLSENRTFYTTLDDSQISNLWIGLVKNRFINNKTKEEDFYRIFSGNPERLSIEPIHWIASSPTRPDDHYSTPLLLTFLELLVEFEILHENFFDQPKQITNGIIRKCFRIGSKYVDLKKKKSNINSNRIDIKEDISTIKSILYNL